MHCLIHTKHVRRGNTRPTSADIQCFSEFNEFHARRVGSTKEYRNLNPDTRGSAGLRRLTRPNLYDLSETRIRWHSTRELVQKQQVGCQFARPGVDMNSFYFNSLTKLLPCTLTLR